VDSVLYRVALSGADATVAYSFVIISAPASVRFKSSEVNAADIRSARRSYSRSCAVTQEATASTSELRPIVSVASAKLVVGSKSLRIIICITLVPGCRFPSRQSVVGTAPEG